MASISSSSAIEIIRRALGVIDGQLVSHGERTAYILYKMLEYQGKYSQEDMQKFFVLAMLHDIGAYKTNEITDLMDFDYEQVWPHSVYGFFYLKYLSPYRELARILLYHHLNYDKSKRIKFQYMDVAALLNVADRAELLLRRGEGGIDRLKPHAGSKYSPNALQAFRYADGKYHIIDCLKDGSYKKEISDIIQNIHWSENGRLWILRLLVYSIDFKNEETVVRNISTNNIAQYLGERIGLSTEDLTSLRFAALVYDLGMLSVPHEILNAPRRLTDEERKIMRHHVQATREILEGLVPDEIMDIATRHHERMDGSGYPQGLTADALSLPQRILATADTIAAMGTRKPYKPPMQKEEILQALRAEVDHEKLGPKVTGYAIEHYNDMKMEVGVKNAEVLEHYLAIKDQFDDIIREFEKYG